MSADDMKSQRAADRFSKTDDQLRNIWWERHSDEWVTSLREMDGALLDLIDQAGAFARSFDWQDGHAELMAALWAARAAVSKQIKQKRQTAQ